MSKNLQRIENEIRHYNIPSKAADVMRQLGELGLEFSGHGYGGGGEDFSFNYPKDDDFTVEVTVDDDDDIYLTVFDEDGVDKQGGVDIMDYVKRKIKEINNG